MSTTTRTRGPKAATSQPQGASELRPRGAGGKFAPKNPTITPEQTDQIADLAAVLANPEGRKLSERVATLESDLSVARTRLTASEREVSDLKAARDGYETGRRDVQSRLEKAIDDLREVQQERDHYRDATQRIKVLEARIQTQGRDNLRLDQRLADATTELAKVRRELGDAQTSLCEAKAEIHRRQFAEILHRPALPAWAWALAAVIVLVATASVAHRAGFNAHASLIGGAR